MHRASLPVVCEHLRAKGPFGQLGGEEVPWQSGEYTNATYWCLCTMDAVGPDDRVVHAQDCRDRRPCFRAPDED